MAAYHESVNNSFSGFAVALFGTICKTEQKQTYSACDSLNIMSEIMFKKYLFTTVCLGPYP